MALAREQNLWLLAPVAGWFAQTFPSLFSGFERNFRVLGWMVEYLTSIGSCFVWLFLYVNSWISKRFIEQS